jgi:hypothetical protein
MLQFHLSKAFSKDMSMHVSDSHAVIGGALQWYAHRVTVLRRKCVIAMEWQSRYCIVFAGLKKPDFKIFPELFADRLWREVVSICQLDDEQSHDLAALVDIVGKEQYYQVGFDRSVQAHINDVAWNLNNMANEIGYLPEKQEDAFGFGLKMNEWLRKRKGDKEYMVPLEVFRDCWLGMLEHVYVSKSDDKKKVADVVPFRRH